MKVIERSEFRNEDGEIGLEERIRASLRHGLGWYGLMQAQEIATERIDANLGGEHILLRNAVIPGTTMEIPMLLLSPQGVRVLIPSPLRGVYRAKGDDWLRFDSRSRRFKRARPNPQTQALNAAEAVYRYFRELGYDLPEVEPVLVFTNPRTHIDHAKPAVRIVQADAIEHFSSNLERFQAIMDQDDIQALRLAITDPKPPEPTPLPEPEPTHGPPEVPKPSDFYMSEPDLEPTELPTPVPLGRLGLSTKQWALLIVMAFFEVVILIALVFFVLANTVYA